MGSSPHTRRYVHILPRKEHTHTVIFLHGRDSIATEFANEFFESQGTDGRTFPEIQPTIRWVFPTSKMRKSDRFDEEISQWFDIYSVERPSEDEETQRDGLLESVTSTLQIIRQEASLVPLENIILGGISQGCATAIFALLCGGARLGGFIGLSSWLPFQNDIEAITQRAKGKSKKISSEVRDILERGRLTTLSDLTDLALTSTALETPIFLSHSKDDRVVPVQNGKILRDCLQSLGLTVTWKEYGDGGHWIKEPQGVDDMVTFLRNCLNIETS